MLTRLVMSISNRKSYVNVCVLCSWRFSPLFISFKRFRVLWMVPVYALNAVSTDPVLWGNAFTSKPFIYINYPLRICPFKWLQTVLLLYFFCLFSWILTPCCEARLSHPNLYTRINYPLWICPSQWLQTLLLLHFCLFLVFSGWCLDSPAWHLT